MLSVKSEIFGINRTDDFPLLFNGSGFREYVAKYYPKKEIGEVMEQVDKWLFYLKKGGND
jgi:hypothetical protein